jgi:hypothetical protein
MDTAFLKPVPTCGSFCKKRRQNNDRQEENCASKKKRKGKRERANIYPLGEMARHEEQR